jgi:hypothetical protein
MADNFRTQILNSKGESASMQTPVRTLGSCTFMYLRHADLYILMVTRNNANVMMAFKFMTSVRQEVLARWQQQQLSQWKCERSMLQRPSDVSADSRMQKAAQT